MILYQVETLFASADGRTDAFTLHFVPALNIHKNGYNR
jgi:hypothetical protein